MMIFIVFTLEQGTLIFLSVRYTPIKFNNSYTFPWWGYGIGWFLASSSLIMIPITMICKVAKKDGTLWQVSGYLIALWWKWHYRHRKSETLLLCDLSSPSVWKPAPGLLMIFQRWHKKWKESWRRKGKSGDRVLRGPPHSSFGNLRVSSKAVITSRKTAGSVTRQVF